MPLFFNFRPRFMRELLTQWENVHLPPPALCRYVTTKDKTESQLLMDTMDHIFSYRNKKFICACSLSRYQIFLKISVGHSRIGTGGGWVSQIHKFANKHQAMIQGQGHFTKWGLRIGMGGTSLQTNIRRWSKDRDILPNEDYRRVYTTCSENGV